MDQNNTPAPKPRAEFQNLMTRHERVAGWIYLPIHIFLLPLLLPTVLYLAGGEQLLDNVTLNVWYYLVGLVYLFVLLFRYYRESYAVMMQDFKRTLITMLIGYGMLVACNILLTIIVSIFGGLPDSPNDTAVTELVHQNELRMIAAVVIMAPIVEETLFRGMIFGALRPKHRVLAYAVTMVAFALYHVWQYVVFQGSLAALVSAVAYLPIAFVLTWCYDRTGSIWTSIFFHMFYNALAMMLR